jgi:hypothetical protein
MTAPVTLTLSGATNNGTVFWYLSSSQALIAGHNSGATLTCSSGCTVVNGTTTFPPDSVPLWQTTFTSNVWDPINLPAMDKRAIYSRDVIVPGPGLSSISNPSTGVQTLSTDPTQVPRYFAGSGAPALSCTASRDFYTDTTGLNLYFCDAANTWKQASGGGASRLTDFLAVDTSATVQTIGGSCAVAAPCQIRLGTQVFTMTAPVTATLSGTSSSGTVYWYLSSAQVLTAGHNSSATLTCSTGCTVATGITAFPADSVPLWQTTFTANVWDPIVLSTMDKRAVYSRNVIAAGNGISSNVSGGIQTLSTDPTQSPRYFTGSGAPSSTCTAGRDFYTDTTGLNLYFCDAANIWKQANGSGPVLSGSQVWFPMLSPNPVLNTSTRGSTTYTASTAYYMQLWTPVTLTVKSVTPLVDTGVAGAFGDIAFFDFTCTKIAGSDANFSMATTATYPTVTLGSAITIPAGIFYYAWAVTSATAALDASISISSAQGPWYFAAGTSQSVGTLLSFTGSNAPSGSGAAFALPSACGTKTINSTFNVPITLVIQ